MPETGFLGTAAPRSTDIILLLEMGMGAGLLAGAWLARVGRFRIHAACQSAIVILNLALIIRVVPKLPGRIGRPYYALATAHAVMGGVAELGGLYILLAAGTDLLPEKLRIVRLRVWMRSLLLIWWIVLLLGMATYARWYMTLR
jgi:hypothetical protein